MKVWHDEGGKPRSVPGPADVPRLGRLTVVGRPDERSGSYGAWVNAFGYFVIRGGSIRRVLTPEENS